MKERIQQIIQELRIIIREECLSVSHDALFSKAILIYNGERENKRGGSNQSTKQATDKQIAYAHQLADKKNINITITGKETTQQISKLIKELQK